MRKSICMFLFIFKTIQHVDTLLPCDAIAMWHQSSCNLINIGSGIGLRPIRHQAINIIWFSTNAGFLLNGPLETNFQ